MLSPKQAVERAKASLREHYEESETKYFRVEEIRRSTSGEWLVTFGWVEPGYAEVGGSTFAPSPPSIKRLRRVYKRVRLSEEGEFRALEPYTIEEIGL